MRQGVRLTVDPSLYASETKFGYEGKAPTKDFRYVVEGERLTFRQIEERLPDVGEKLLQGRLHRGGFSNTWADLGKTEAQARQEGGKQAALTAAQRRARNKAYRINLQRERAAIYAARKAGHKDL